MRSFLRLALLLVPLVLLHACDSGGDDDSRIGITGRWAGSYVSKIDPNQTIDVVLELQDDGVNVIGTGSLTSPTETLPFSIPAGLRAGAKMSLTVFYERPPQGQINGLVSDDFREIRSVSISGPGFANSTNLTLNRAD
ncbi:MAG: hypothetical protein AAF624_02915 [Bacteroidota bacterium]